MYPLIWLVLTTLAFVDALHVAPLSSTTEADWADFLDGGEILPTYVERDSKRQRNAYGVNESCGKVCKSAQLSLMIFGAYNTGTNAMTLLLDTLYPHANVCPGGEKTLTQKHCFRGAAIGKHVQPYFIREWLGDHSKSGSFKVVMVLRNPLSFLSSLHKPKHSYGFQACAESSHWFNQTCECAALNAVGQHDKLCSPGQTTFTLADAWNTYARMYMEIQSRNAQKAVLYRYEDLVLKPFETLVEITTHLKIPLPRSAISDAIKVVLDEPAKLNGVDLDAAKKKLRDKRYLEEYTKYQLQALCARLDKALLSRFGYADDCLGLF